jgi:hypothetical protein
VVTNGQFQFRIVLILGHQENLIVSNPSVVISTLPSGIPVSPPSSVRVAPIDSTRISVSWEPGPFPHGPLLSYVLQITDNHPDAEVPPEVKVCPNFTTSYFDFLLPFTFTLRFAFYAKLYQLICLYEL